MGTPVWLSLLLAVIPLAGVVLASVLLRRTGRETVQVSEEALANAVSSRLDTRLSALELDTWRRREETMRMLRWSAEKATDDSDRQSAVGTSVLVALSRSELLQPQDRVLVAAVLNSLVEPLVEEYDGAAGRRPITVVPDLEEGGEDR